MIFYIFVILITFVYIAFLELSKNMLISWAVAIVAAIVALALKAYMGKREKSKGISLLIFLGLVLVFVVSYILTGPPAKRVPAVDNNNPDVTDVVEIPQGELTGVYNKDHSVKVYAGIPYAKAPVGDLRFKEPQAPEKWEGVLKADHFGPMAMQTRGSVWFDSLSHILGWHDYQIKFGDEYTEEVSEDCLYLNVFSPERNTTNSGELLPVIFYVHGGSLTTGQSSYSEYRGEDLAKKGVVFVNFAYRLGVFGYYAAEDLKEESPNGTTGNYGLLDQIAALKWVHENIKAFGGDPDRITIAGESAGSSSVNALCVSPLTEGLFNYAIAESSGIVARVPFHTFRFYDDAIETGDEVRKEFGVSSSKELRAITAKELVKTRTQNSSMTVDGYAITEQPYLTYEKGNNHEKALLNGFNQKEADAFLLDTKATKENYVELLADDMGEYADELSQVVPYNLPQRDQHFIIDGMGEAKGALNLAYSAIWFSYSHYVWNNYMVKQNRPAYEYYFTKTNNMLSNYHAGEIPYAYGNLWRHPGLYDDEDYKLSEIMQNYWVNFAKTGDPNGAGLPRWEMRSKENTKLLNLDTDIKMMEDPNNEIYKVIDKFQESQEVPGAEEAMAEFYGATSKEEKADAISFYRDKLLSAGIDPKSLEYIDRVISSDIDHGFSSAQMAIIRGSELVFRNSWGHVRTYDEMGEVVEAGEVTNDSLYDLASNTKMYTVNYAIQYLVTNGSLDIDTKIVDILGKEFAEDTIDIEYKGYEHVDLETNKAWKADLSIRDLLMHRAGFPAGPQYFNDRYDVAEFDFDSDKGNVLYVGTDGDYEARKETLYQLFRTPLMYEPGTDSLYSDLDFMILCFCIEEITGQDFDDYLEETFYKPMGLTHITFNPLDNGFKKEDCVATEVMGNSRDGNLNYTGIRKYTLQGEVHDPNAFYCMAGVSGHAGLFSNAEDLAKLASVMLTGKYQGKEYFSRECIETFTAEDPENPGFGLGWWVQGDHKRDRYFGTKCSRATFGHQGFTGTLTMIDPEKELVIVLLTNKIHSRLLEGDKTLSAYRGNYYTTGKLGFAPELIMTGIDKEANESEYRDVIGKIADDMKETLDKKNITDEDDPRMLAYKSLLGVMENEL
ncbi:MAG: carboxylesterase family protein [Butyrivibrio sp.]|nr:carboxylesterase family protein [Butyrivibrio sp.]